MTTHGLAESAARVGAEVVAVPRSDPAAVAGLADGAALWAVPAAGELVAGAGATPIDPDADPVTLTDLPAVVTRARAGVVESGSVLLVSSSRAELLAETWAHHLLVLLDPADVVDELGEVAPLIDAAGAESVVAILSGPSRTADIERRLTIGVQGPSRVTIVLLED